MKKNIIRLLISILFIICSYFIYADYKKDLRYENYISSQILQSLGSIVNTMNNPENKISDEALSSIVDNKAVTIEQLNKINSLFNFYVGEIQDVRSVANHLDMEHNNYMYSYISSSRDKLFQYIRQLERNKVSKVELQSDDMKFFKHMQVINIRWSNIIKKYNEIPNTELYEVSKKHWINLYNELGKSTQENLN